MRNPYRKVYTKYKEFNILPDIVADFLGGQGEPVPEKSRPKGLVSQMKDVDREIWHTKKGLDRYVEEHTKLRFANYVTANGNDLYKAIAGEIRALRLDGYIEDWGRKVNPGKEGNRPGVWRPTGEYMKLTSSVAKREMKDENFYADLAESTIFVRTKQDEFRKILLRQYEQCLFCSFPLKKFMVAAHIVPYYWMRAKHPHDAMNPVDGMLLCRFCDTAFEHGTVMLEPDYSIVVKPELKRAEDKTIKSWVRTIEEKIKVSDLEYKPSIKYIKEKKKMASRMAMISEAKNKWSLR